jgi:hypothetical protein
MGQPWLSNSITAVAMADGATAVVDPKATFALEFCIG